MFKNNSIQSVEVGRIKENQNLTGFNTNNQVNESQQEYVLNDKERELIELRITVKAQQELIEQLKKRIADLKNK